MSAKKVTGRVTEPALPGSSKGRSEGGYAVPVDVRAGRIDAFYLFDVAESADLSAIPALIAGQTVPARLAPKPATPAYVQYDKPPLLFDGDAVGVGEFEGFKSRVRVYDY